MLYIIDIDYGAINEKIISKFGFLVPGMIGERRKQRGMGI